MSEIFAKPEALDQAVRRTLSKALRSCLKSRDLVISELSAATGALLTLQVLNNYTAESRRSYRFPAAWVIPFCRITDDDSLQRLLLTPELAADLELGECVREKLFKSKFPGLNETERLES